MKNVLKIAANAGVIILFMFTVSCGNKTSKDQPNTKEYTSEYVCPMHCEGSGDDKAGDCPVCGMDYVKNEKTSEK